MVLTSGGYVALGQAAQAESAGQSPNASRSFMKVA